MAIQIPNAGTGNGETGDNEFVLWTKVVNNFSDQTNAASRLLGTGAEQVPLSKNIPSLLGTAATKNVGTAIGQVAIRDAQNGIGSQAYIQSGLGAPSIAFKKITGTFPASSGGFVAVAHGLDGAKILSYQVLVNNAGNVFTSDYHEDIYKFSSYINKNNIAVNAVAATNLLGKPLTIFITYEVD